MRALLIRELAWQARAACRPRRKVNVDQAEHFFPLGRPAKATKQMCGKCRVREDCLAYALREEPEGIWGGTTDREREELRARAEVEAFIRGETA